MKSAILTDKKQLKICNTPVPSPKEGEVLIKTIYTGICRTDRKAYHMSQQDLNMPRVLGHEIVGMIETIGSDVKKYNKGEYVQIHPGIGCGTCLSCLEGNDQICEKMQILGFHIDGGFSQYILIPKKGVERGIIQKIPSTLPLELAVLSEPLACAINIEERMDFSSMESILLIGGGALGLLMANLAKEKRVKNIVLIEKNPYKVEIAKSLGFTAFSSEEEISTLFDAVVPCCPDNAAFHLGLKRLKKRGVFGFFSGLTADSTFDKNTLNLIHYKEITMVGAYGCSLLHGKKALERLNHYQQDYKFPTKKIQIEELESVLASIETEDTIFTLLDFTEDKL